ncbi:hypothetical protein ATZ36_15810 [Candidatus Endomicrobiellum trichonymphae]|uniref:Uncharacterized protein n=1 Tax=Endomicrobium trichonymphae TaxID=1408204 RepID=A0A1E5ILE8_ENDTX|nr:hypothetical protein ATZ36_15810 [Candidatus Endomicrobium trichonymphae]
MSYLKKCVEILKNYFDIVDIEIYPLDKSGYKELADTGADRLTVYQEIYNEELYKLLPYERCKVGLQISFGNMQEGRQSELKEFKCCGAAWVK